MTNPASDEMATWSPDGRRWPSAARGGHSNIFLVSVDGEQHGIEQLTNDGLAKQDHNGPLTVA